MVKSALLAIALLGCVGVFLGTWLALAARKFAVEANPSLDFNLNKTASGAPFIPGQEINRHPHNHCIRCGWCLDACPLFLQPNEISVYVEAGRGQDTAKFGLFECTECGQCALVCPAKRPLVQFIHLAKLKAKP